MFIAARAHVLAARLVEGRSHNDGIQAEAAPQDWQQEAPGTASSQT
jgi:hypothetical protein